MFNQGRIYVSIYVPGLTQLQFVSIYYNNIHAFSWNFFVAWTPWMGLTFGKTVHFAYNLYETV